MKRYALAGLFGTLYALLLGTERGKEWIDAYTTIGVVLGVSGVLIALRSAQSREEWRRTVGAFVVAGLPMMVRGVVPALSAACDGRATSRRATRRHPEGTRARAQPR